MCDDKVSAAYKIVADYQKDINNIKSDLITKISVLDVKLNILIAIALISAAKTIGLF